MKIKSDLRLVSMNINSQLKRSYVTFMSVALVYLYKKEIFIQWSIKKRLPNNSSAYSMLMLVLSTVELSLS